MASAVADNSILEKQGKYVQILNNKLVVRVYKLDNSKTVVLVDPTSTIEHVLKTTIEKLGIPSPDEMLMNFSLHSCLDGVTIQRALDKTATLLSVLQGWEEELGETAEGAEEPDPRIVLQVRLYTSAMLTATDSVLIRLMYIQAVYHVIATLYQMDIDLCIKLAGLQLFAKFGKYSEDSHKEGFLRSTLLEYIPGSQIRKRSPEDWEKLLFDSWAAVDHDSVENAELEYIRVCAELDYYGCALFPVKQMYDKRLQRRLILGVNSRGILLLKPADGVATTSMKVIAEHSLNDIYRWAYKPGVNMYFEVKPEDEEDENPLYMFSTSEGKHIADLLTDYAMGLLREMGLNADGSKRDDADEAKGDGEDGEDGGDDGDAGGDGGDDDGAAASSDDLPEGWREVPDEASGAVYYYNNNTGESRWDRPTE